ncbi:hypothetical protein [Nocardioides sp.]|uniref:glycosyltransferase n=1 Tax=Nocardioides sp. TaxID=35761 RepID=UPI001A1D29F4|nr:hypothetical protein [Nocardioides sp.]MBJ7356928.1 hypothetical protein [Nocardioides sp.]
MHVVMATPHLVDVGGSETYLYTVAENLVRLGHEVTVHAPVLGAMAEQVRGVGATVVDESGLPEACDAVLVQDVGTAYAMADRWPGQPQVYVAHSAYFDLQLPPLVPVPGSVVVVMSDRVGARVGALPGTFETVRLRQPIDAVRLSPRGTVSARPRRAVLLGNYLRGEARDALVEAWSAAKVRVVQVGVMTRPTLDVAAAVADADIVVGKGRAVLDAMACGRPAFVYDVFGADGWVTAASYDAFEADAFAGQSQAAVLDRDGLVRALDHYDPAMGRVNRELILKHHQDRKHAEALVGIFRRLTPGGGDGPTEAAELARLSRLRWKAELEAEALRGQVGELTGRLQEAQEKLYLSEQRRRRRARAARRAEQRLAELEKGTVDATQ